MKKLGAKNQHQLLLCGGVSVPQACQCVSVTSDLSSTVDSGEDVLFEACVV